MLKREEIDNNYIFFIKDGDVKEIYKIKPLVPMSEVKKALKDTKAFSPSYKIKELEDKKIIETLDADMSAYFIIYKQ